jgi:hypothetical protein
LSPGIIGDIFAFCSGSTTIPGPIPKQVRERALALGLEIVIDHHEIPASNK